MAEHNQLDTIYQKLSNWLQDIQQHEVRQLIDVVEEAKALAHAAESLSQERVGQFVDNLKYDLKEFSEQWQQDSAHSIYLGLLNETWWDSLAKAADKSQIEWAELPDDFAHDGIYQSGDYIGFGVLVCRQCDASLTISHFSQVASCAKCGHDKFYRQPLSP
ncbi:zinc ribbon-containing protein [Thalassotalea montiporae]